MVIFLFKSFFFLNALKKVIVWNFSILYRNISYTNIYVNSNIKIIIQILNILIILDKSDKSDILDIFGYFLIKTKTEPSILDKWVIFLFFWIFLVIVS